MLTYFLRSNRQARPQFLAVGVVTLVSSLVLVCAAMCITMVMQTPSSTPSVVDRASYVIHQGASPDVAGSGALTASEVEHITDALPPGTRTVAWRTRWMTALRDGAPLTAGSATTSAVSMEALQALGVPCTGRTPTRPSELAVQRAFAASQGWQVGSPLRVQWSQGRFDATVTCLYDAPDASGHVFGVAPSTLREGVASDSVAALMVVGDLPRERVDRAAATVDASVQASRDYRVAGPEAQLRRHVQGAVNVLATFAVTLLISAMVVLSAMVSLLVKSRIQDLVVLRALGVSKGTVARILLGDLVAVSVPCTLVAVLVSGALAPLLRDWFIDKGVFPPQSAHVGWEALASPVVVAAAVMAVFIPLLAGWSAVRSAMKVEPIRVLSNAETASSQRGRRGVAIAGLVTLALGIVPLVLAATVVRDSPATVAAMPVASAFFLLPAMALLGPWLMPVVARVVSVIPRMCDRAAGYLAVKNVVFAPTRVRALFGPAILATGLGCVFLCAPVMQAQRADAHTTQRLVADTVTVPQASAALPVDLADRHAVQQGWVWFTPPSTSEHSSPSEPTLLRVLGVNPRDIPTFFDVGHVQGSLSHLNINSFAAGQSEAGARGWKVGDQVGFTAADGAPVSLTLAAIWERDAGTAPLMFSADVVHRHALDPGVSAVYNASEPLVAATTLSRAQALAQAREASRENVLVNVLLALLLMSYPLVALAGNGALAQSELVGERRRIRAVGGSRGQVNRLVAWESSIGAGSGVLVGLVTALCGLAPLALATGHVLPSVPWWWIPSIACSAMAAAIFPSLISAGWRHPVQGKKR